MDIFKSWQFYVGILLYLLAHHADYLYQASLHEWPSYLDLAARAPHWGLWDFIPHDNWHLVQTLRNMGWLFGPVLVFWSWAEYGDWHWRGVYYNDNWPGLFVVLAVYYLTRALGFSLMLWVYGVG